MPNLNYKRSRARETQVKHELEKQRYYAVRAAGSHGIADVIGIKPTRCDNPSHFEVKFIQIKVSENIKEKVVVPQLVDSSCGPINVEFWKFPVRSKTWYKNRRNAKNKINKK